MTAILIIIVTVIAIIVLHGKKSPSEETSQPMHFDLLDENGDPVKDPSKAYQPPHFDLLDENGDPIKEPEVKNLEYFCVKDKGYHVSVWPKDKGIGECFEFRIAGINHVDNIDNYLGEFTGTLVAEPTNPYDSNAIKILASDGHHVGYVPKDQTQAVRNFTPIPCPCYCYIWKDDHIYYSCCYVTLP